MSKIILSLDSKYFLDLKEVEELAEQFGSRCYAFKVHAIAEYYGAPVLYPLLRKYCKGVMADVKLHDLRKTVKKRAQIHRDCGATIITAHASGGVDMLQGVVESGIDEVLAISILTSLKETGVQDTYNNSTSAMIYKFARRAKQASCGMVCSPADLTGLPQFSDLASVRKFTPGVRSPGVNAGEQVRVATPAEAIRNGATCIIVESEILEASNREAAFARIEADIKGVN